MLNDNRNIEAPTREQALALLRRGLDKALQMAAAQYVMPIRRPSRSRLQTHTGTASVRVERREHGWLILSGGATPITTVTAAAAIASTGQH